MAVPRWLRGSTEHCPKCASSKIVFDPTLTVDVLAIVGDPAVQTAK
jgi:hypothetical protein